MTAMFSSPPKVQKAKPAPAVTDPSVQAAAEAQRTAQAQAAGRASTILTSGLGDTAAPQIGLKTMTGQ